MSEHPFPSRRDFLSVAVGAFVVTAVPWAYQRRNTLFRRSVPAMGTLAELAVVHHDERYAHHALEAAVSEMQRVERLMTRFTATSDVGRANRGAAADAVEISPETALVLRHALAWAERSDGAFDPALARLTDLWDVRHRHEPPRPDQVARLAGRRLYRALDLGTRGGRPVVRFSDPDVALDLGGIACGYGVDRAVAVLRAWEIRNGFINVGGDIYALGHAADGEPWRVGVRSPADPQALVESVALTDAAIATTGDYEQFFDHGGRRYSHILDPATAEPRRARTHTVTVTAESCLVTDAATTTAFGLARPDAERLLAGAAPGARIVHLG